MISRTKKRKYKTDKKDQSYRSPQELCKKKDFPLCKLGGEEDSEYKRNLLVGARRALSRMDASDGAPFYLGQWTQQMSTIITAMECAMHEDKQDIYAVAEAAIMLHDLTAVVTLVENGFTIVSQHDVKNLTVTHEYACRKYVVPCDTKEQRALTGLTSREKGRLFLPLLIQKDLGFVMSEGGWPGRGCVHDDGSVIFVNNPYGAEGRPELTIVLPEVIAAFFARWPKVACWMAEQIKLLTDDELVRLDGVYNGMEDEFGVDVVDGIEQELMGL